MALYGRRWLGIYFQPLVETDAEGLIYKGKRYLWSDIEKVDVWDVPYAGAFAVVSMRAQVYFKDGTSMLLVGSSLERKGQYPTRGFFVNKTRAFDELVTLCKINAAV